MHLQERGPDPKMTRGLPGLLLVWCVPLSDYKNLCFLLFCFCFLSFLSLAYLFHVDKTICVCGGGGGGRRERAQLCIKSNMIKSPLGIIMKGTVYKMLSLKRGGLLRAVFHQGIHWISVSLNLSLSVSVSLPVSLRLSLSLSLSLCFSLSLTVYILYTLCVSLYLSVYLSFSPSFSILCTLPVSVVYVSFLFFPSKSSYSCFRERNIYIYKR